MEKSISVVAPAYNHERFIEKCLLSIASQNCENMELIVLDDCSRDGTRAVIRRILKEESFRRAFSLGVTFIPHEKNRGAHDTINEGLMRAKGKYLAVINTDDAFGDGHLRLLLDACEREKSEFGFGGVRVVDEKDRPVTEGYGKAIMKYQDTAMMCPTVTMALSRGNSTISTGNMIFTAGLYKELGGFRNYKYVHDWDFALRAALLTEPVFVPEACYFYRLHGGNTISEIAGRPQDADRMEKGGGRVRSNPLKEFFERILQGQYTNEKIPPVEVWDYFFNNKKYYSDDYDAGIVWEEAKKACKRSG